MRKLWSSAASLLTGLRNTLGSDDVLESFFHLFINVLEAKRVKMGSAVQVSLHHCVAVSQGLVLANGTSIDAFAVFSYALRKNPLLLSLLLLFSLASSSLDSIRMLTQLIFISSFPGPKFVKLLP